MSEAPTQGRPMPGTSGHGTATVDVRERGAERDGQPQILDSRLFMQLCVYRCPAEVHPLELITLLGNALGDTGVGAVVYEDVNDPRGIGVLSWSENPADFVQKVRP